MSMLEDRVLVDIRSLLVRFPHIASAMTYLPMAVVQWLVSQVVTSMDPHDELTDSFLETINSYVPAEHRIAHAAVSTIIETILDLMSDRIRYNHFVIDYQEHRPGLVIVTTERLLLHGD